MVRYTISVRTPMPPEDAFAYMADLRNFAAWDPGVEHVEQVNGEGAGPDASFAVGIKTPAVTITLRYDTVTYEPSTTLVAVAKNAVLTSRDTITVQPDGDGSVVTYDAVLTLNGLLRLADRLLGPSFGRMADRAAAGLIAALAGERIAEPVS